MRTVKFAFRGLAALIGCLTLLANPAMAQADYPQKPVKVIIPFGPGTVDVICRETAQALSSHFQQTFFSENRAGAGGAIANKATASAAPDGYTLLCSSSSMATEQALRPDSGFDGTRDLVSIAPVVQGFYGVYVNADIPVKSIKEFAEYVQKNPGRVKFASAGIGSSQHLATEKLLRSLNLDLVHVPYTGAADALLSTVRNDTQLLVIDHAQAKPIADSGKLRLLALSAAERFPAYPDVPTAIESGVPGYAPGFWFALFAPAGTDAAIVTKINAALRDHFTAAEVQRRYLDRGYRALWSSADDLSARLKADIADWKKVIAEAGIKVQ